MPFSRVVDASLHLFRQLLIGAATPEHHRICWRRLPLCFFPQQEEVLHRALAATPLDRFEDLENKAKRQFQGIETHLNAFPQASKGLKKGPPTALRLVDVSGPGLPHRVHALFIALQVAGDQDHEVDMRSRHVESALPVLSTSQEGRRRAVPSSEAAGARGPRCLRRPRASAPL